MICSHTYFGKQHRHNSLTFFKNFKRVFHIQLDGQLFVLLLLIDLHDTINWTFSDDDDSNN